MQMVRAMYAQGGAELVREQLRADGFPDEVIAQVIDLLSEDS